jgi:zinc/manganese transport system permease protein
MNWDVLDWSILGPALVAGVLVLSTHVPLGREVLARGIIFIDLALAQIASLGVVAATALGWEPHGWAMQVAAAVAAIAGAALLYRCERVLPQHQEALIGSAFVLAATLAILLLAKNPHGGEHLKELLAGQILWVGTPQLLSLAIVSAALLGLWFGLAARRPPWLFYGVFAVAVTASVQVVGVYLVFASLILPALSAHRLTGARALWTGYGTGAAGFVAGIVVSALWDLPTGPTVVWTLAVASLAVAMASRRANASRP